MSYGNGGNFDPDSRQVGQRSYPQSHSDPSFPQRQPQPSSGNRTLLWILGVIAAVVLGGGLLCCGLGYFAFQTVTTGLANQLRPQIQNSPEIVEHIGEIQEMTISVEAMQQTDQAGTAIFEVQGSKGSGQIAIDLSRAEAGQFSEGIELILPDGRRIPLTGVGAAEPPLETATPPGEEPLQEADTPQADTPQADTPQADTPQADTPQAPPASDAPADPQPPAERDRPLSESEPAAPLAADGAAVGA